MAFKARLGAGFYAFLVLLAMLVAIGWIGIFSLNANGILLEDGTPVSAGTRLILTVVLSLVVLTWTVSLGVLIRQMLLGGAFVMDESGICNALSPLLFLSLILIVPIKRIPYCAVRAIREEKGVLVADVDKSQIEAPGLFRFLIRRDFAFSLTSAKKEEIEEVLRHHVK